MLKYKKIFLICVLFWQFANSQNSPIAQNDTYSTETNKTLTIAAPGILINDTDEDGDTLEVTSFLINGTTYTIGQTASLPEGDFTLNADGSFQFVPSLDYSGSVPNINYTISDGSFTSSANLTIVITNIFPPTAINDYDTAEINTTLSVVAPGILVNDFDQDNNAIAVIEFIVNGISYTVGQTATFAEGTLSINADGSFTFVPTAGYTGNVPQIIYIISDGFFSSNASLFLTVEHITNLLEVSDLESCNQGYTAEGEYKIIYSMVLRNKSTARDYHPTNLIQNIDLTNDFQSTFGAGCILQIDDLIISTNGVRDYVNNPYPLEFDDNAINPDFLTGTSNAIFNSNAINNFTLYPRQSVNIEFCITIDPNCGGRVVPTPSGSGIDFNNIISGTSSIGNSTTNLILTDFHTSNAVVTAGLYVPEPNPIVNPDGTFEYTNTVIITNEGTSRADNINYIMGLGSFYNNGVTFKQLTISQVAGPPVTVNGSYDGNTSTTLLDPNNFLDPGETIVLEVFSFTDPISSGGTNLFNQSDKSQTQGILDGFDELTAIDRLEYSYVVWEDALGNHLDRYYPVTSATETASSTSQCTCESLSMRFLFSSSSTNNKTITSIDEAPNGILEHEKVTFQLTLTNTSPRIQLKNLQLEDDLNNVCSTNIVAVSTPFIQNSTATTNPILNTAYDGIVDPNFFNGSSGLLLPNESITIQFTVIFNEDCINTNSALFSATNPIGNLIYSSGSVAIDASTDTDMDGVSNANDIDDDNDTIPDTDEYNGFDPLEDHDVDFIPNYRDPDFGVDANSDGIIDLFDFDNDGVPNHFDLDSDNDGILDIVEAGNASRDTNRNGRTNSAVGANGLDNGRENNDSLSAIISYSIPNSDGTGNSNFIDIDADGDGIVDIIEAQTTDTYTAPNKIVNEMGIDTAFPNGIAPVDTENDAIFDYIDTNSDNDIRNDQIEGWDFNNDGIAETIASNSDLDNDGLDDAYDQNDGLIDPTNGQIPTDFPNIDNTYTPERDWREIIAIVLLINDVREIEGENLTFTISLVTKNDLSIPIQSASPINIDFSTINGTDTTEQYTEATAPYDYNSISTTLQIPAFSDTGQQVINSLEDLIFELDELFTLNGTITSNNTINTEIKGIGTILNNDIPPAITMNNSKENEGESLVHTISISHPSSTPVQIDIITTDNTAINPDDYTAINQSFTIPETLDPANANTEISFSIPTLIDNINEANEEYLNVVGSVTTSNVSVQDLIKTGTILDIDPYPSIRIDNETVVEGNPLIFTIQFLNPDSEPLQNYLPINLEIETSNETARASEDYQAVMTIVTVPAFTTSTTQKVVTINDQLNEDTETLSFKITDTSPFSLATGTATGFIKDDDFPNLFSPNADGKSDVFEILGIEDFPNFKLIIIDRWGSEVYNYSNEGKPTPIWWDGTHKGKPVIEGVYYYTLDFNDGTTAPKRSFIQLIR